jgi:hypothetical protein
VYAEREPFKSVAPHPFRIPAGLVQAKVCLPSGLLATRNCGGGVVDEIFLAEETPLQVDASQVQVGIDRVTGLLAGPNCPADRIEMRSFSKTEPDVRMATGNIRNWLRSHARAELPTETSNCGVTEAAAVSETTTP